MPRGPSSSSSSFEIRDIVGQFVDQLSALIEHDAVSRAREAILSAFSGGGGAVALSLGGRRRGRPPGRASGAIGNIRSTTAADGVLAAKSGPRPARKRRKAPIQLCPVPGCTNRAAPVFGMVCAKHKDLPKSEIKRFREARRARRDQPKGARSVKASKVSSKTTGQASGKATAKGSKSGSRSRSTTSKARAAAKRAVKVAPKPVALVAKPTPPPPV